MITSLLLEMRVIRLMGCLVRGVRVQSYVILKGEEKLANSSQ